MDPPWLATWLMTRVISPRTALPRALLSARDAGGGDQLHRTSDLLGRLDRLDASAEDPDPGRPWITVSSGGATWC
jgi:hypothetical protein